MSDKERVCVRLSDKERAILDEICVRLKTNRSEAIRSLLHNKDTIILTASQAYAVQLYSKDHACQTSDSKRQLLAIGINQFLLERDGMHK